MDEKKSYPTDCKKLESKLIRSLNNEVKFPISINLEY